jgi:hypothetical protein
MGKRKRRLTAAEKAAKRKRRAEFRTVFIGGKMKRVRRPPTIDGMEVNEFIRRNADLIWLHEEEAWELMETGDAGTGAPGPQPRRAPPRAASGTEVDLDDLDLPF